MSLEDNPELVASGATIIKDVWEIRIRDYGKKLQVEEERMKNSALPSITQEWAGRLLARQGPYKRVERKDLPYPEILPEGDKVNITPKPRPAVTAKKPQPQITPKVPVSRPAAPPAGPKSRISPVAPPKKVVTVDRRANQLKSLMTLTQTLPSPMIWGKSWKYNKGLPLLDKDDESPVLWGQNWMLATQQPHTEAGQPWPNGPNQVNPASLQVWDRFSSKVIDLDYQDPSLPVEDWETSWKRPKKERKEKMLSEDGEDIEALGKFYWLLKTQRHYESLSTSEWSDSWAATKPSSEASTHEGVEGEDLGGHQAIDPEWLDSWQYPNPQVCDGQMATSRQTPKGPEWAHAWKVATAVSETGKTTAEQGENTEVPSNQQDSHLHKVIMSASHRLEKRNQALESLNEPQEFPDWTESWLVTKTDLKPSEEIEQVLKLPHPTMEDTPTPQQKPKDVPAASEKLDPVYEKLRHEVLSQAKLSLTSDKMSYLDHLQNVYTGEEWEDSWRTLKHMMRTERRRMRPHPSQPFRAPERDHVPVADEWADSWKQTHQVLQQEEADWEQGWDPTPQVRAVRAMDQNHFREVETTPNGPGVDQLWVDSRIFSRRQHASEHVSEEQPTASVASEQPADAQRDRGMRARGVYDWHEAWMFSANQLSHDRPSLTQWMDAWRLSAFQTEHWHEELPSQQRMARSMELERRRDLSQQRARANLSHSLDPEVFEQRFPQDVWSESWRAPPPTGHQAHSSQPGGSPEDSLRWGKSFRIAHPMPKIKQHWLQSAPNRYTYSTVWSASKSRGDASLHDLAIFKQWEDSHLVLQKGQETPRRRGRCTDRWQIAEQREIPTKDLFSKKERDVAGDKTWVGCHLLGKTQPRPKKGAKPVIQDNDTEERMFDMWHESWRLVVPPSGWNKRLISFAVWGNAWQFLIPPYPAQVK